MSQFFKALEQAERDRKREEEAAAQRTAPEAPTSHDNGRSAVESTVPKPAPERLEPTPAERTADELRGPVFVSLDTPPVSQAAAPPVMKAPAPKPATPRPPTPPPATVKPTPRALVVNPATPPPAPRPPVVAAPPPASAAPPPPVVTVRPPAAVVPTPPVVAAPPAAPAPPPPVAPIAPPAAVTPTRSELVDAPSPASVFRPALGKGRRPALLRRLGARLPMLIAQTHPNSVEADAYRTLRAKIELMSDNGGFRHIAITSAVGGDGKSTTAANLAVVTAQSGLRVCLIDADLRRPTLHEMFGLQNVDGLSFALEHGKPLSTVAKAAEVPNLSVVVAGRGADETFRDVVTPQRLEKLLRDSQSVFDLIIFDTPPVTAVADAVSVAAVCDGVILVVRPGTIPLSALRRAVDQVQQVKGRMLGVLLNRVHPGGADSYSYGYGHAYTPKRSRTP